MKKILLVFFLLCTGGGMTYAQKYLTRTGKISFNASLQSSPEKIEAVNNEVATIVDGQSGRVIFQVLVKSFKFERQLMEEHFNENYMESDKYNKADFDGAIANLGEVNLTKNGTYEIKVVGKLTIHGVTKEVNEKGTLMVEGKSITLKARFPVKLEDYKIAIPSLVADKVARDAMITLESVLTQK